MYKNVVGPPPPPYFDVKIVSEHIPLHRETISSTLKLL